MGHKRYTIRSTRWHHPWCQRSLPFAIAVGMLLVLIAGPLLVTGPVEAQTAAPETATVCTSTKREYTLELCLTAPDSGTPIREDPTISATVTLSDPEVAVRSVEFELNGRRTLTDFNPPYSFSLATSDWVDGGYTLSALANLTDDTESNPVASQIMLATGTESVAPPIDRFEPTAGRPAAIGEPFVVGVVGDGASGAPESAAVTDLITSWNPNLFLYLGDVYNSGTYTEFLNWYAPDTYFGRFRGITNPTVGNHEYSGADVPRGYQRYWGNPPHYYSVDTAGWHIVSLDSNAKFNELNPASQQMQWLVNDLESANTACTVVMFHHPPFSAGPHGDTEEVAALWKTLVEHDVTLVLTGHDHNYQRWQPMNGDGELDADGTTSLVIGNGGQTRRSAGFDEDDRLAAPVDRFPGALRMELNPSGAALQFVTTDGIVRDSEVVPCDASGEVADTMSPTAPGAPRTITSPDGSVTLRWSPALDDTGIAEYDVFRDNELIGTVPPGMAFIDREPETASATYHVVARDAVGNVSPAGPSTHASTMRDPSVVFEDSFTSGSLARWTTFQGLAIAPPTAGSTEAGWMARARGGIAPAYARITLPGAAAEPDGRLNVTLKLFILDQGTNPVVFLRGRSANDESLFGVSIGINGTLGLFNDVTKTGTESTQKVEPGVWHDLTIQVSGPIDDQTLRVRLDGQDVPDLSGPIDLQETTVGAIQLGDSAANRIYDVQYQEIRITSTAMLLTNADDAPMAESTPQVGLALIAIALGIARALMPSVRVDAAKIVGCLKGGPNGRLRMEIEAKGAAHRLDALKTGSAYRRAPRPP